MSIHRAYYHPIDSRPAEPGEVDCLHCCNWDAVKREAGKTGYCTLAGVTPSGDTCKRALAGPPIHGKNADSKMLKIWFQKKREASNA